MATSAPLYIVAMGARTPVGESPACAAAAIRAGISRVRDHAFLVDEFHDPLCGAMDAHLDETVPAGQRMHALADRALAQVEAALARCSSDTKVHVLLAGPEYRPGWKKADERAWVDGLRARGVCGRELVPAIAGRGHAGALAAVHQATALIRGGHSELCIVCGADSYFDPRTVEWLLHNRQLRTPRTRGGFFPGEAAGALAITSRPLASSFGLPCLAQVAGSGLAIETELIKADSNNLGRALSEAIVGAVSAAGGVDTPIDSVFADINGERYKAEEWAFVILRTQAMFRDPSAYEAACDRWGDVGAASGALLSMLAVQSWSRGYARGKRAMIFAGSEAGSRAAVLLAQAPGT